jgi:hypothetical protein
MYIILKSKAVPLHAMNAPEGEEVQLLLILNLGTRWGWVVGITLRPHFILGKGHLVPIEQEAGWAPEPVWTQRLEEETSASVGDRIPVIQSIVRHYNDWATLAPMYITFYIFIYYIKHFPLSKL